METEPADNTKQDAAVQSASTNGRRNVPRCPTCDELGIDHDAWLASCAAKRQRQK